MRRFDKEFPNRGGTWQRIINERRWSEMKRRGIDAYVSFSQEDRFKELGMVASYRYRLRILRTLMSRYEKTDHWRRIWLHLHAARQCDKPRLP